MPALLPPLLLCVIACWGAIASALQAAPPQQPAVRPHITFVMADDLGANDVGWSDPTVLSPTIDALGATLPTLPSAAIATSIVLAVMMTLLCTYYYSSRW